MAIPTLAARWSRRLALAACAFGVLGAAPAFAADWPGRAVTLVVPYPAGGATDVFARVLAQGLSATWKQPVMVDNRPGGSGIIGAEAVARAAPDGHTLLFTLTTVVQAPHLSSSITFDPRASLEPVTMAGTTPLVLVVNPDVPAKTAAEYADLVRKDPKKYGSYGTFGAGSSAHLLMENWSRQLGLNLVHVAYRGEAPSITDVLGGQVPAVVASQNGALPHMQTGRLRALALTGPVRAPGMPDVPTFKELGYQGMDWVGWFGVFAPKGTPQALLERIAGDINRQLKLREVAERTAPAGIILAGTVTPAQFRAQVQQDYERWGKAIRDAGVKLD